MAGRHRKVGRMAIIWMDLRRLENLQIGEVDNEKLNEIIKERVSDRCVELWTIQSADKFIRWRNQMELPDWEGINRKNISKDKG